MDDYPKYTTNEMIDLLSHKRRYFLFRKLWMIMAQIEKELGFDKITDKITLEMRNNLNITDEDLQLAKVYEEKSKHEVIAQIEVFKTHLSSEAGKYLHLGCTSCYVQDNADMLIYIEALKNIKNKIIRLLQLLNKMANQEKATICVGYTHYQPAQFVTVGKRFALYSQSIYFHITRLERLIEQDLYLLGCKGATGTQDSYLKLFNKEKVLKLDEMFSKKTGYKVIPLSGQTYTRTMDTMILDQLGEIASSIHKIATDIRLWQHDQEIYEPFDEHQVGSSAMAYKQNPMRSERVCSLARVIMNNKTIENEPYQWFERTLDDSASRRLKMKESLLLTDYIITLMCNIISGIKIIHPVITKHINEQLNYIVTENIMMKLVSLGKDRMEVHEKIRQITLKIRENELNGIKDNIAEIIRQDEYFKEIYDQLDDMMDPKLYAGICVEQIEKFNEIIKKYLNMTCDEFDTTFKF
jgi:adenylosuccinate lyase